MKKFLTQTIKGEFSVWRALLHWIGCYTVVVAILFAVDSIFPPSGELYYFTILMFVAVIFWFTFGVIISGYKQMMNADNSFVKRIIGSTFLFFFLYVAYLIYSDITKI